MSKEIDEQVTAFLQAAGVTYSVQFVGATTRDTWECDEWRVSFKGSRIDFSTEYFTGVGHRADTVHTKMARQNLKGCNVNSIAWQDMLKGMKALAPSAASVLHSLILDAGAVDESFIDWCENYGYNADSRKALATYDACCETGRKLRLLFTREQRTSLDEMLQDY